MVSPGAATGSARCWKIKPCVLPGSLAPPPPLQHTKDEEGWHPEGDGVSYVGLSAHWVPWFDDSDLNLTCLAFSPSDDFCLLGCQNGTLLVAATQTLCPQFEPHGEERDPNYR